MPGPVLTLKTAYSASTNSFTPMAPALVMASPAICDAKDAAVKRLIVGCGLVALGALVTAVAQAPADPYFAQTLQAWEQGRFVRFHGLAQWVGWLWPYAAIGWFLAQLGRPR